MGSAQVSNTDPVERADLLDAEISSQPASFAREPGPEHDEVACEVDPRCVADGSDAVAAVADSRCCGRGRTCSPVPVQDHDDGSAARSLRRGARGRFPRGGPWLRRGDGGERVISRGELDTIGNRLYERSAADYEKEEELEGRDPARDERSETPRPDECIGGGERVIHARNRFARSGATPSADPEPSPRSPGDRRRDRPSA